MIKLKKGFSLTELLISLLVISMVLAAAIPAITKRASLQHDNIWHWTNTNNIAYSAVGSNQNIIVGTDSTLSNMGKVNIAQTAGLANSHIAFYAGASTYVGRLAMTANSLAIGSLNTAASVTGSHNIAIGAAALRDTTSGQQNVAIGSNALLKVTTGKYNTAVGVNALNAATAPSNSNAYNTALGVSSCTAINTGANNLCLGYNSGPAANSNNTISIGNKSTTYAAANVMIGAESLYAFAQKSTSDIRKKNVLGDNKAGLKEINQLEVKNFTYKDDKNKIKHVGVIAQQLQKIFPNAVTKDSEGYLMIRQEDIFYAMVNSIKELSQKFQDSTAKITGLDKRLSELETQNKLLKEQNAQFEKRLQNLEKLNNKTK